MLCQNIGMRANHEDGELGKFFQGRFRAVRFLDEVTLMACAAYVDLTRFDDSWAAKNNPT